MASRRHVNHIVGLLSSCLIVARQAVFPTAATDFTIPHGPFYLRSHLGKCLSYGSWDDPVYPGDRPRPPFMSLYIETLRRQGTSAPDDRSR